MRLLAIIARLKIDTFSAVDFNSKKMKVLLAFDFDHTIIHFNSDIVIEKLVPKEAFTEELKKIRDGPEWLVYMQEIFNILHRSNVSKDDILQVCADCESTEGMVDLIKDLKQSKLVDIIIISDSNTVFIEHWLKSKCIFELIDKIYTNPANFNSDGLLEVQMYHDQDWCELSVRNLCKGYVLEAHLKEEKEKGNAYDFVAFVGDGRNDLCPSLKLTSHDFCFPRENFHLDKILKRDAEMRSQVKASVHPWKTAQDISDVLKQKLTI